MSDETETLEALKSGLETVHRRLRGIPSLARCKVPSQRDFLARELLNSLGEMQKGQLDELLDKFMTGDRPNARDVQTLLQVLIEARNLSCIDTVITFIELRVNGHFASEFTGPEQRKAAQKDAWWGDACLQPFENTMLKNDDLRKRVRSLMKEFRQHTETTSV